LLPAKHRLKASREFQTVFSRGRSVADSLLVLYVLPRRDSTQRFGFSVGRKLGGAVQRNRVKRVLREAVRHLLPDLATGKDYVVIARRGMKDASFEQGMASLDRLFRRAGVRGLPEER
jgi:ribonuclease P protein component